MAALDVLSGWRAGFIGSSCDGELRRRAAAASCGGELRRRAAAASCGGELRRRAGAAGWGLRAGSVAAARRQERLDPG
ncbi:hypothetical protein [Saccharopolyspora spinosa]|uniref:hypothetical protein n=1 Tax=Saccharopolyspora spinosa TaxID=60894 RepID=UPI001474984C|nr:hypothetical protein [Saccharopolyspora spinosa]